MARDARDALNFRQPLGRNRVPKANGSPCQAQFASDPSHQAALGSDKVHALHNDMLSTGKRMTQEAFLPPVAADYGNIPLMDLSDTIRRKRREAGLTQRELAERVGVSPGAVAQWEGGGGGKGLSAGNLVKVCLLLGIELNELGSFGQLNGQSVGRPDETVLVSIYRRMTGEQQRVYLALFHTAVGEPIQQIDSPAERQRRSA